MDKKSLLRILDKLGKEGQIKNIIVTLNCDNKEKVRLTASTRNGYNHNKYIYSVYYFEQKLYYFEIFRAIPHVPVGQFSYR
jgi:hypothetical protein